MKTRTLQLLFASIAAAATVAAPHATAANFRSYLSLSGSDANPCTLPAPCRLLPAAIAATNDGGEVWMLNSANYNTGPVTITQGIKILAIPGEVGSIVGNGGDGLIINAPGKDVTLRNLVILNLAGGMNGVNIVDAGAVHIEKTTIHDFSSTAGACVLLATMASVRVYIDDSFMRHCRAAIHVNVPPVLSNRPSLVMDNTRIERGFADTGQAVGIWQQGCADVTIRNSMISRQDVGILADSLVSGCVASLQVNQSQMIRNSTGIQLISNPGSTSFEATIVNSQITKSGDGIAVTNTGNATSIAMNIIDSVVAYCGNNCITYNNQATDDVNGLQSSIVRTHLSNATNTVLDLSAPGGGRVRVQVRDSTVSNTVNRLIKTSGAGANVSGIQVSLIRSNLFSAGFLLDHGYGQVRLDGCHMTHLTNTFVNSGSADVRSLGNNWLTNFTNTTPGLTYITPTVVGPI